MKTLSAVITLNGLLVTVVSAIARFHESWEAPADYIFPNIHTTDPSLDKPRVLPRPKTTRFEGWGFVAVSRTNPNESVSIIFLLATDESVPNIKSPVSVTLAFGFADGSTKKASIDAVDSEEGPARLHTKETGSSGAWGTTGASWKGSADGKSYTIDVHSDMLGIWGTLNMKSIAALHYLCTTGRTDSTILEGFLRVGYTTQISDAKVSVDFKVKSSSILLTKTNNFKNGAGKSHHMWSDRPVSAIKKWNYNCVSIGEADVDSISWLQGEDGRGKVFTSVYIARKGQPVVIGCEAVEKGKEKLDGKRYKVELFKDVQVEDGIWAGVAVGGELRGAGMIQESIQ